MNRVATHLILHSLLLLLLLGLNAAVTRANGVSVIEAQGPSLQRLFLENQRQELSERLLVLSETMNATLVARTSSGNIIAKFETLRWGFPYSYKFQLGERSKVLATITVQVPLFSLDVLTGSVWLLSASIMQALLIVAGRNRQFRRVQELRIASLQGIAGTVAAVSHDVRKPFSLFKLLLTSAQTVQDPAELRALAKAALPEVQLAMDSVEGLLQDVMQVGAAEVLIETQIVSVEALLDEVLKEIFRGRVDSNISFDFEYDSQLSLCVDFQKVKRIFSNIISNACQAMSWTGSIWLSFRRKCNRMTITIGNDGSFIPEENIPKLFDAFFTSNKRGGTGLGLAIAKKWTEAHGGQISCHSERSKDYPNGMVEFTFDLPAGSACLDLERPKVHNHSSAYRLILNFDKASEVGGSVEETSRQIKERLNNLQVPLHVVALDDEAVFLDGLRTAIESLRLGETVRFSAYPKEPAEGLDKADLHLVDFDLSLYDRNGFDVIRELRTLQPNAFVCLHTNRTDAQTFRGAVEAGADAVYTKPITPEHIAKLLIESLNRRKSTPAADAPSKPLQTSEPLKLKVAFADDSLVMRLSWKRALAADVDLKVFSSPEEIMSTRETFDVVVTDMNFDNSDLSGKDVANWVRTSLPKARVLLCSNEGDVSDVKLFSGRVPKSEAPTRDALFPVD